MTWAAGDSQPEKFETARGFYVASYRARKRPGRTIQGFQKALARLPLRPLRALHPELDTVGRMPLPALTRLHGDPEHPRIRLKRVDLVNCDAALDGLVVPF